MAAVVRETVQLDPIWAFRANHVHFVLSTVLDYWADELGTFSPVLPTPLPAKDPNRAVLLSEAKEGRVEMLEHVDAFQPMASAYDLATSGVPLLYASVLWEAIRDWADNCYSPFAVDQRRSLQAYWWFMGLPFTTPTGMKLPSWKAVASGQRRKYKIAACEFSPLPHVGLSLSSLFIQRIKDPDLPPFFRKEQEPITFLDCCGVLGLDPPSMRTFIHTIRPD